MNNTNTFVGVKEVNSAVELRSLLDQLADNSYYFLRWAHRVSGFEKQLPKEFPSPEGQMFNCDRELRWKQKGQKYSVLLLSTTGSEPGFTSVGKKWEVENRNAHVYRSTGTRFTKGINDRQVAVAQRYFIDKQTSTVHFVALTVKR